MRSLGRTMVTRHLEIHPAVIALLAVGSFIGALAIYTTVQVVAQNRLAEAYQNAEFEGAFCDNNVAFDGNLCRENLKMSWQQIYALLTEAQVVDGAEIESYERLKDKTPEELKDLLATLTDGSLNTGGAETALGFIVRLAGSQCLASQTKDSNPNGEIEKKNAEKFLALALSDALVGGSAPDFIKGGRCDAAREYLQDLNVTQQINRSPSGWRFSTARCLSDSLILSKLLKHHRAIKSTASDKKNDEEIAGYDVTTNTCVTNSLIGTDIRLKRFEAYTTLIKYVLGQTHAESNVRSARKFANVVRGPEHVGILTVALMVAALVAVRWTTLERRFIRARLAKKGLNAKAADGKARAFEVLARTIAAGGERAERGHEALNRGRILMLWGLATIPAIGFVGTVRGILEALSKAENVVWAVDRLERAEAIAELSGELGLAFSTTLFALLASIVLGLLVTLLRVREGRCLDRLAGATKMVEDR